MPDRPIFTQFDIIKKPVEKSVMKEANKDKESYESECKKIRHYQGPSRRELRLKRRALKKRRKKGRS